MRNVDYFIFYTSMKKCGPFIGWKDRHPCWDSAPLACEGNENGSLGEQIRTFCFENSALLNLNIQVFSFCGIVGCTTSVFLFSCIRRVYSAYLFWSSREGGHSPD